jgi:hypothetical protein
MPMNTAVIKPEWSPLTIVLMLLGFVVFWPLGLAVLAYILWGQRFSGSGDRAERWFNRQKQWAGRCGSHHGFAGHSSSSGNAAFDAYREEQLKRLDEERRKLDDEVEAFHEHMRNLRMARDREEFDRYMRDRQNVRPSTGDQNNQSGNPNVY